MACWLMGMSPVAVIKPLQCIAVALENYISHSLPSLVPIRILCTGVYAHGHETLQGMGK